MDEEEMERLARMQQMMPYDDFLRYAKQEQARLAALALPSHPQARAQVLAQVLQKQLMQQGAQQMAQQVMQQLYGQQQQHFGGIQNGQHWQSSSTLCGGAAHAANPAYAGWTSGLSIIGTAGAYAPPPVENAGIRAGEVEGFRAWIRIGAGTLHSIMNFAVWPPDGIMRGNPDQSYYGVHAFKTADMVRAQYTADHHGSLAYGRVALWGVIVEHEDGYRAEFARITAIDQITPSWSIEAWVLNRLRRHYGLTGKE